MLSLLALMPAAAVCCDQIPANQAVWVRLTSPISSFTAKPGDKITAVLTAPIKCDNDTHFAIGTQVNGTIRSVRKVGWGIRHETAALDLNFNELSPDVSAPVAITTSLTEVENAREQVSSKGVIQGIRSSDTPEGRINSRLRHLPTWNPYSDLGLIVYKATFPIFPEPEIYLPTGTDLRLKLTKPIVAPAPLPEPPVDTAEYAADDFEWQELSRTLPTRTTTTSMADADLINILFVGSREQVQIAFHNAGWTSSDTLTKHAFLRNFYAFLNNSGYPQEPMRPFLLNGEPADMKWQKSLNSYARRDHLRMWEWTDPVTGKTVWLSASTHDTGAALSLKYRQFVHHISPEIDEERSKVVRDLTAAGCVQSVHMIARRGVPNLTQSYNGDPVRTDGSLAVVTLKDCQSPTPELAEVNTHTTYKPGNKAFRYLRRQILTFRSDIWRANIIYGVYDLGHMSLAAIKHHNSLEAYQREMEQHQKQAAAAPATPPAQVGASSALLGTE
jgi:LssY-like putative type I secretion system component LssY